MADRTIRAPEQLAPRGTAAIGDAGQSALDRVVTEVLTERAAPDWAPFSLELNPDQIEIRDWVHEFAATVVRPAAAEWDEREETPWPIIHEAAANGLYGLESTVSSFMDPSGLLLPLVSEELFWGDAGIGLALFGTHLAAGAIFANGTPEQLQEWLPRCFGTPEEPQVAAFCTSEPDAGSEGSALRTRARFDEATQEWVITGQKSWATNGGIADVHVVVATLDPTLGTHGQAAFVIPRTEVRGLSQGKKLKKHGLRASHTAEVFLDEVRVPAANVLGGPEKLEERLARARERAAGGRSGEPNAAMSAFELTRHVVGAQALGVGRAAFEVALDYARERRQFGRAIIEHQALSFLLADMAAAVEVSRATYLSAARRRDLGLPFTQQASIAKLVATDNAMRVTTDAVQVLGGVGYTRDFPLERYMREAKVMQIFEGTNQIQRMVIGRSLGAKTHIHIAGGT